MKKYRNYIFDFDGTLAHTSPEILYCLKQAFGQSGIIIDDSELSDRLIGPTMAQIIEMLRPELPAEKTTEVGKNFRNIYDNSSAGLTKPYPNIMDKLISLKNDGCRLFIATNKAKKAVFRLVRELDMDFFDDIYAVDRYEKPSSKTELVSFCVKEHSLDRNETIMVGDNPGDIKAGNSCGIDTTAVLWGYASYEAREKMRSEATCSINSITELP